MPYFIALAQHSLVGDYIAGGGLQLLWPITTQYYGIGINMQGLANTALEWTLFLVAMFFMLRTGDFAALFKNHNSNFILAVPIFTVLLPPFLSFPSNVPLGLMMPHIVYLATFLVSIIIISAHKIFRS